MFAERKNEHRSKFNTPLATSSYQDQGLCFKMSDFSCEICMKPGFLNLDEEFKWCEKQRYKSFWLSQKFIFTNYLFIILISSNLFGSVKFILVYHLLNFNSSFINKILFAAFTYTVYFNTKFIAFTI